MSSIELDAASVLDYMIYSELEDAWRTDSTQLEGERTYAVHKTQQALREMGFPIDLIIITSTFAAKNISEELNAKKTR